MSTVQACIVLNQENVYKVTYSLMAQFYPGFMFCQCKFQTPPPFPSSSMILRIMLTPCPHPLRGQSPLLLRVVDHTTHQFGKH